MKNIKASAKYISKMEVSNLTPKLIILLVANYFFNWTCTNATSKNEKEKLIVTRNWFYMSCASCYLKGAVAIDTAGTLIAVGQKFTRTDSIDHPTIITKISAEGKIINQKTIGRTGLYKYNKRGHMFEDRLVQILKHKERIILFGYKLFYLNDFEYRLWIVEIDQNLNVIKDTVYMNLAANIGEMKAFNTNEGWLLMTRTYWQDNGLSRYGNSMYEFDENFKCKDPKRTITAKVDDSTFRLTWVRSAVKYGNDIFICGHGGNTHANLDEDNLSPVGIILKYNIESKQAQEVIRCEKNLFPTSLTIANNQICILYINVKKSDSDNAPSSHLVICYDANYTELWRDDRQIKKTVLSGYVTWRQGEWQTFGHAVKSNAPSCFFELRYDQNGKLLEMKDFERVADVSVVGEIMVSERFSYRLLSSNGWRIDKLEYSN
ncbi:MAG: hypothetical protein KG003_00075 [Bacteroidetes bacterium]|nr:hypothetical protein [Bacteroidota bacterium]